MSLKSFARYERRAAQAHGRLRAGQMLEFPGYKAPRVACEQCGESVSFRREAVREGRPPCCACAGEAYRAPA